MTNDAIAALRALHGQATTSARLSIEPVEESEGNVCIKHAHFDLYYQTLDTDHVSDLSDTARRVRLQARNVNFACVLGDERDVRALVSAFNALPALLEELERLRALTSTRSTP